MGLGLEKVIANPKKGIHVSIRTSILTLTVPQEVDEQDEDAKDAGDKADEGDVVRYQEVVREGEPRKEENKDEDDWENGQLD